MLDSFDKHNYEARFIFIVNLFFISKENTSLMLSHCLQNKNVFSLLMHVFLSLLLFLQATMKSIRLSLTLLIDMNW